MDFGFAKHTDCTNKVGGKEGCYGTLPRFTFPLTELAGSVFHVAARTSCSLSTYRRRHPATAPFLSSRRVSTLASCNLDRVEDPSSSTTSGLAGKLLGRQEIGVGHIGTICDWPGT